MSLSDYVKYLRALHGGITSWEIAEKTGVPTSDIHIIEVKHRRVGEDDTTLGRLAEFFGVGIEEFTHRREAYRKALTQFLVESLSTQDAIVLKLESGEQIEGGVAWYSREAIAVVPSTTSGGGGEASAAPYIVQRACVADWRQADEADWRVDAAFQVPQR